MVVVVVAEVVVIDVELVEVVVVDVELVEVVVTVIIHMMSVARKYPCHT